MTRALRTVALWVCTDGIGRRTYYVSEVEAEFHVRSAQNAGRPCRLQAVKVGTSAADLADYLNRECSS